MNRLEREEVVYQEELEIDVLLAGARRLASFPVRLFWTGGPGTGRDRALEFEVSDASDLMFLYAASVSEVHFRQLKKEQSLVVEFSGFSDEFILLLESARHKRLRACLRQHSESGHTEFALVETNQFKNLDHLALVVQQASDVKLKDYLAARLRKHQLAAIQADALLAEERQRRAELESDRQAEQAAAEERLQTQKRLADEQVADLSAAKDRLSNELDLVRQQQQELRVQAEHAERERNNLKASQTWTEALESRLRDAERLSLEFRTARDACTEKLLSLEASQKSTMNRLRSLLPDAVDTGDDLADRLVGHVAQMNKRHREAEEKLIRAQTERSDISRRIEELLTVEADCKRRLSRQQAALEDQKNLVDRMSAKLKSQEAKDLDRQKVISKLREEVAIATEKARDVRESAAKDKQVISWLNRELNLVAIRGTNQQVPEHQPVVFKPSASMQRTSQKSGFSLFGGRSGSVVDSSLKEN